MNHRLFEVGSKLQNGVRCVGVETNVKGVIKDFNGAVLIVFYEKKEVNLVSVIKRAVLLEQSY